MLYEVEGDLKQIFGLNHMFFFLDLRQPECCGLEFAFVGSSQIEVAT